MTDKNLILDNDFEDSLKKSLKSLGYLFPTTENEVEYFEENNILQEPPLDYCSASDLLKKEKISSIQKTDLNTNYSIDNLARAARNGGTFSDEILNKMKADRDKAENDQK